MYIKEFLPEVQISRGGGGGGEEGGEGGGLSCGNLTLTN